MSTSLTTQHLQHIAITLVAMAKAELSEEQFSCLPIPLIQPWVLMFSEAVPFEHLADPQLLRHAIYQLINGNSIEETLMHVFTLSIFRLSHEGSNHPLERGIIRQRIIGILPRFEHALNTHKIRLEHYDKNADALVNIAEDSIETPAILAALAIEYARVEG